MSYSLFIDDERFPPNDGREWIICRTMEEVQATIIAHGFPMYISFDHDLGEGQPTGHDIAKWIVNQDLDDSIIPAGFTYYVHSQNPIGAANIRGLLDSYLRATLMYFNPMVVC